MGITPPKVIGLCGRKGTGKNTIADIVTERLGHTQISFAQPLREVCKIVFGLSDEEMNDRVAKETTLNRWPFLSPRQILQLTGTELFRNHFPGVWIERLKSAVSTAQKQCRGAKFVITDVRFPDEADAIRELGGVIIRVTRPGFEESDGHTSETQLSLIEADAFIVNHGSIADLITSTEAAIKSLPKNA